jgi:hypothetical protein
MFAALLKLVCLSSCENFKMAEWMFINFDTGEFCEEETGNFSYECDSLLGCCAL